MYNAFTFKKEQQSQQAEKERVRPLKETDPDKAAKRTNRLSLNAKIRRENWLHTINFENDDGNRQELIENPGNDSLAYRTSFYDFRGEKNRDKSKDISTERFKVGNYQAEKQRAAEQEQLNLSKVFTEKDRRKDELREQVMRPTNKLKTSPRGLHFNSKSEAHRVLDKIKGQRRFEPDGFNARRLVQADLFRIERRGCKNQWLAKKDFVAGGTNYGSSSVYDYAGQTQQSAKNAASHQTVASRSQYNSPLLRFPSISAYQDSITASPRRPHHEPFNMADPIGKRGIGKQVPFVKENTRNAKDNFVSGVSMNTISSMGFDYNAVPVTKMSRMGKTINVLDEANRFTKKRSTQPFNAESRKASTMLNYRGETDSNRFFDTFTKFQKINLNLEIPSPFQKKSPHLRTGSKFDSISPKMLGTAPHFHPKTTMNLNNTKDYNGSKIKISGTHDSAEHLRTHESRNTAAFGLKQSSGEASGSAFNVALNDTLRQQQKYKEPSDAQKMRRISMIMRQGQEKLQMPMALHDVIDVEAMRTMDPQQRTAYQHKLTQEWKEFVNSTNVNFMDQNKLYLKSMQDYLAREYKQMPRAADNANNRNAVGKNLAKIQEENNSKDLANLAADIQSIGSAGTSQPPQELNNFSRNSPQAQADRTKSNVGHLSAFASQHKMPKIVIPGADGSLPHQESGHNAKSSLNVGNTTKSPQLVGR